MKRFVIFYSPPIGDCDSVCIDASSFDDACIIADSFNFKFGYIILGVCPEYLIKSCFYVE